MNCFSYFEPVCCSMSSSNCCFLTCIQISQEADQVLWYSHLFQNFPQFIDEQPRQHIKKQRHYFADKGLSSQSYGLSSGHVWMWELDYKESWALKNWCFWTVVLEKTRESTGLQGRSNQSIPKEISPEYSLKGLMLKQKLQYFGFLMQRTDSLEKTLMLGKIEGKKRDG